MIHLSGNMHSAKFEVHSWFVSLPSALPSWKCRDFCAESCVISMIILSQVKEGTGGEFNLSLVGGEVLFLNDF